MAPFIRVFLHMLGGMLISMGHIPEDFVRDVLNDPELVGSIVIAVTWLWYYLAKKMGWMT